MVVKFLSVLFYDPVGGGGDSSSHSVMSSSFPFISSNLDKNKLNKFNLIFKNNLIAV